MLWINLTSRLHKGVSRQLVPLTHELTVATSVSEWTLHQSLTLVATAQTKVQCSMGRD